MTKIALITGSSRGLGKSTALNLAKKGVDVIVTYDRNAEEAKNIVAEIEQLGAKAVALQLNTADTKTFDSFATQVQRSLKDNWQADRFDFLDKFGRVDVIFNNAGVMPLSPMNALKVEEWDNMINVNIQGVLNGIAAGLPIMEAQGGGQIINTASIGSHVVAPTAAVYCATKYAVWAISEGLRQESQNIHVTTISPGVVETELGSDITDESSKGFLKELRKTALTSDAIARAVLYAVAQPEDVDVNEIIVRPTASAF